MEFQRTRVISTGGEQQQIMNHQSTGVYTNRYSPMRLDWMEWISANGPYDFHLSTSFVRDYSESVARSHFNYFIHRLNQELYGKKYKQRGFYLQGLVFMERQARGAIHYHGLIKHDDIFCADDNRSFESYVMNMLPEIREMDFITKKHTGRSVFNDKGVKVDAVWYEAGIIDYLTKMVPLMNGDSIGILGAKGVEWGDVASKHV